MLPLKVVEQIFENNVRETINYRVSFFCQFNFSIRVIITQMTYLTVRTDLNKKLSQLQCYFFFKEKVSKVRFE